MSGEPSNARLWADADVYVAFLADTPTPTNPSTIDDPFGADWDLVGLLDGEDGFTDTRNEDVTDLYAWGGILLRTSRRNFKWTRAFTAKERNDTTDRLMWPGSSSSQILVPSGNRIERVKVAFETRDGDNTYRLITAFEAEVTVNGDMNENETDIADVPFIVTVFPDSDGVLFDRQSNIVIAS